MHGIKITTLVASSAVIDQLSAIIIETVANGGSVSFMHPLAPESAKAFWIDSLTAAALGKRIVLGAWEGDMIVGTVTVLLDCPPNQPHRAEIAKLMTRVDRRGRGIATALMQAAEAEAASQPP